MILIIIGSEDDSSIVNTKSNFLKIIYTIIETMINDKDSNNKVIMQIIMLIKTLIVLIIIQKQNNK